MNGDTQKIIIAEAKAQAQHAEQISKRIAEQRAQAAEQAKKRLQEQLRIARERES